LIELTQICGYTQSQAEKLILKQFYLKGKTNGFSKDWKKRSDWVKKNLKDCLHNYYELHSPHRYFIKEVILRSFNNSNIKIPEYICDEIFNKFSPRYCIMQKTFCLYQFIFKNKLKNNIILISQRELKKGLKINLKTVKELLAFLDESNIFILPTNRLVNRYVPTTFQIDRKFQKSRNQYNSMKEYLQHNKIKCNSLSRYYKKLISVKK